MPILTKIPMDPLDPRTNVVIDARTSDVSGKHTDPDANPDAAPVIVALPCCLSTTVGVLALRIDLRALGELQCRPFTVFSMSVEI